MGGAEARVAVGSVAARDVMVDPGRIGWLPAVAAVIVLVALGELARLVGWTRFDARWLRVIAGLVVPALMAPADNRWTRRARRRRVTRMRQWLQAAPVAPLAFAPVVMLRPPADIATAVVTASLGWWLLFVTLAVVAGHRRGPSPG